MPVPLHPLARRPVAEFLRLADARLPGVVQGLYLVGSIALDDFHGQDDWRLVIQPRSG